MAMTVDLKEFDRAMVQYAAASGKDFKDISNKSVFDAALRSVGKMKKAKKSAINVLKQQEELIWWFAWRRYIPRGMSRKEAYKKAKDIITRRSKASGFMRSFFIKMANEMRPYLPGDAPVRANATRGVFAGFQATAMPATKQRPNADIKVSYIYKREKDAGARRAEVMLVGALQGGIDATTADRMKYVDRKMGRTAKKYSARNARAA